MEIIGEGIRKTFKRFEKKVDNLEEIVNELKKIEKISEIINDEIVGLNAIYANTANVKKAAATIKKINKAKSDYTKLIKRNNVLVKKYENVIEERNKARKDYEALKKMKINQTDAGKKIIKSTVKYNKIEKSIEKSISQIDSKFKTFKPKVMNIDDNKNKVINKNRVKLREKNDEIVKKNIKNIKSGKPEKVKQIVEDIINFFHKIKYQYVGISTLYELYQQINEEIDKLDLMRGYTYIVLYIFEEKNLVRHISIAQQFMNNYAQFEKRVNEIIMGKVVGSDAIAPDEVINYNIFSIAYVDDSVGNGRNDKILFECENIADGFCGYDSLIKCGHTYKGDKKDLIFLSNVVDEIVNNGLKINIIGNTFGIKNIKDVKKREFRTITHTVKGEILDKYIWELKTDDITICEILEVENPTHTIIYDEVNKHFDVIKGKVRLQKNICFDLGGDIYKSNVKVFSVREIITNNIKSKKTTKLEYIFFDYETVIDFDESSCMKEYSLSILQLTNEELENLTNADIAGDFKTVAVIRKKCCKTFIGYDCSIQFIKWIIENQAGKIFCFIGFNNTNFDNFILLNALLKNAKNDFAEYRLSEIFYNGSQLLNFVMNGRHHTFDIHKHLMGSLKDNCESFKIKCCKKLEFDHSKAQQLYLDGELINFITNNDELKDYNEYDVLATAVLFCKYRKALDLIPATHSYATNLTSVKTVGSLIFKVFEEHQKKKSIQLPNLSFKQYEDLQKHKIAGRVELFNGIQEVNEKLVSTDVCSLYPYVMSVLDCYYPCGSTIKEVKKYQGDNELGFYYCDIDQSNLSKADLPNIYAEKLPLENKWDSKEILKDYLISNVMIGLLKKYKCKVVIKSGFVFENKMKSCDMFGFLLDFMKEKNIQDDLKKSKSDEYNSALRETYKLLMNSLSGKVIEGLHTEKTVAVDTIAQYEKIKNKSSSINVINNIGDKLFITYEVEAESLIKQQRPIYLGVLIYDYAKRYMYENSYSKVGLSKLLYTDTDASKFRHKDFINWKKWVDDKNIQVPHWKEVEVYDKRYSDHKIFVSGSKVFGSFEDELEDMNGDEYKFYCLEKKSWLYSYKKDDKWNSKFRFKGLNGSAVMLSLDEEFVKSKIIKHKATEIKPAHNETKYYIEPYSEEKVYQHYTNNKISSIENGNEIKFFKQIYETGEAYVLTQSFRKIVKNTKRNVGIDDEDKHNDLVNNIQVNICMKHIQINK